MNDFAAMGRLKRPKGYPNFAGQDLTGRDLYEADLYRADLLLYLTLIRH